MNEKIKQLALQAGFDDRGSNHTAYMNFDHEKFAELIVRECIDNCLDATERDRIKEHFGVEE